MRLCKRSILATAFGDVICERLNKLFTFLLVQQCLLYHVNFVGMHDPQSLYCLSKIFTKPTILVYCMITILYLAMIYTNSISLVY